MVNNNFNNFNTTKKVFSFSFNFIYLFLWCVSNCMDNFSMFVIRWGHIRSCFKELRLVSNEHEEMSHW